MMITICLCDIDRERMVINVSYDIYLFQKLVYQVLSMIKIQVIL